MGRSCYAKSREILITADGGGSNGYRVKLWKLELQKLANALKMNIHAVGSGSSCPVLGVAGRWLTMRPLLISLAIRPQSKG